MNAIGQVIDELFRLLNDSVSLLKIVNGETVLQEVRNFYPNKRIKMFYKFDNLYSKRNC